MAITSAPRRSISKLNQPSQQPMSRTRFPLRSSAIGNCPKRWRRLSRLAMPSIRDPSGNSKLCHQPFSERAACHFWMYSNPDAAIKPQFNARHPFRYSRTIFGELTPFKALRVSTINAARSTIFRYRYSRFCDLYKGWLRRQEVVLRHEHRAGEKLFVDYAGDTI